MMELDLEKLKKRHREEAEELTKKLQSYMKQLDEFETKRNAFEDSVAQKTEDLQSYNIEMKNVQK